MMSLLFSCLTLLYSGFCSVQGPTTLEVQFGLQARSALAESASAGETARILLYLLEIKAKSPEFPADGPFPLTPGPVIAWNLSQDQITEASQKGVLTLEDPEASFPEPMDAMVGRFNGQLALVLERSSFGQTQPMILKGQVTELTLESDGPETLELTLNGAFEQPFESINEDDPFQIITLGSQILAQSEVGKKSQTPPDHQAFVILPNAYNELSAKRRRWPVIYMIPGSQNALEHARAIARILHEPRMNDLVPQAIWVVLDPGSPYGHHFFADSRLQGQRARALVTELIPWLDVRYRTIPESNARLLLGEEQGGRAALTLLIDHPEVFSNAWALSPEAISFEALGCLDLKRDDNAFREVDETQRPAVRTVLNKEREIVHRDVKDEVVLSMTISPDGRSGEKWDELRASFGRLQTRSDLARWPFDPKTGQLRGSDVLYWMTQDLTERVRNQPELAGRLAERARIFVGENDERYRNLGVKMLQEAVERMINDGGSDTASWVVEIGESDRRSTNAISRLPVHDEIITVLRSRGLHE